jgi:hypothetical protein
MSANMRTYSLCEGVKPVHRQRAMSTGAQLLIELRGVDLDLAARRQEARLRTSQRRGRFVPARMIEIERAGARMEGMNPA